MTNAEHKAKYGGKSLHVHRATPGSLYTVEGCVTLCYVCHVPEPRRAKGQPDLANPFHRVRVKRVLADAVEAAALDSSFNEFVNDCIRMRLEAAGLWPPKRSP